MDAVYVVSDNDVDDDDGDNRIPSTNPPGSSAALMVNLDNPVIHVSMLAQSWATCGPMN